MTTGHDARECKGCGELLTLDDIRDAAPGYCVYCDHGMEVVADLIATVAEEVLGCTD